MLFSKRRFLIALASLPALSQSARADAATGDSGRIRAAATDYLAAIARDAGGAFAFGAERRTQWHWFPDRFYRNREGLALKALSADQRSAADALLAASTTPEGFAKAKAIMRLQEKLGRSSGDFKISVYGDPAARAFGWSLEGHHLSLNYTVVDDQVAAGPLFLGARPTVVPEWRGVERAPMRIEEETARALLLSLNDTRRAAVMFEARTPGDTLTRSRTRVEALPEQGLPLSELDASHRALALEVAREYISAMPRELAAATFTRVAATPDDSLWFGWSGAAENGLYYYRLAGPSWFIEHDNSRNQATHIHSVWRDIDNDFGRRLLGA